MDNGKKVMTANDRSTKNVPGRMVLIQSSKKKKNNIHPDTHVDDTRSPLIKECQQESGSLRRVCPHLITAILVKILNYFRIMQSLTKIKPPV